MDRRSQPKFWIGDSRLPRADWCAEGWADVEPDGPDDLKLSAGDTAIAGTWRIVGLGPDIVSFRLATRLAAVALGDPGFLIEIEAIAVID